MEKHFKGFGCPLLAKILLILFCSLSSTIFLVTDTDSLVALALEACAAIRPRMDAIFLIHAHFRILFIAKFKLLKLHSKIRLFEQMFEFSQIHLGLNCLNSS